MGDSSTEGRPLRVCFFGTYRANYTRNQILIKGLRAQGAIVHECHATLWQGIEDRVEKASGGWLKPRFWWRVLASYWHLFRAHRTTPEYDVMLIGYPGQFDSYLGRLLTWWRRKPMALDILMSLYLVAEERGLTVRSPFTARLIYWLEKGGLKLPDLLLSENGAYEAYYCRRYHLRPEQFRRVPHGADDSVFHPRPLKPRQDRFQVTYHGSFVPSHGIEVIVRAAELLRDRAHIHFQFFGEGPERASGEALARELGLGNVVFRGFVSGEELLNELAQSHICLGVFGTTRQSHYTIQNKVWEGLAMGRPVVSGESAVIGEALVHREHIYLVERKDPGALAEAILALEADATLREELARRGYEHFRRCNSVEAIGRATERALRSLVSGGRG